VRGRYEREPRQQGRQEGDGFAGHERTRFAPRT
jgi:hypothetical protein